MPQPPPAGVGVTDGVTGGVTDRVTDRVTDHVTDHVTGDVTADRSRAITFTDQGSRPMTAATGDGAGAGATAPVDDTPVRHSPLAPSCADNL